MASASVPDGERPLRRDARRNRERILRSASVLFAQRGLETTLDDIAAHAGVGVGTVYRRYPNKDALLDELFEDRVRDLVALAEEAAGKPDAWGALVEFLERLEERFAADLGLQDIVVRSQGGQERVARAREQLFEPVSGLVARAKREGRLRADFADTDLAVIHAMLAAVIERTHTVSPDLWRRFLVFIVDGLERSRARPTRIATPPLEAAEVDVAIGGPRRH